VWVVGDLIIGCIIITMIYLFSRSRIKELWILAVISYVCAPLINWQNTTINSGYAVTGLLAVFCLYDLYRKKIRLTLVIQIFLLYTSAHILIVLLATFFNGVFTLTTLTNIIGILHNCIGIVALALQAQRINDGQPAVKSALWKGGIIAVAINIVFGLFQVIWMEGGYRLTYLLYTGQNRIGIIQQMHELGFFYRMFGTSYTPITTSLFFLLVTTMVFVWMLKKLRVQVWHYTIFSIVFAVCLLTFSKTLILGVWIIFFCGALLKMLEKGKAFFKQAEMVAWLKRVSAMAASIACAFVICTVICYPTPLRGQVNYYFGTVLSTPLLSLESRYAINTDKIDEMVKEIDEVSKEPRQSEPQKEIGGVAKIPGQSKSQPEQKHMSAALAVFLVHPFLGVGPSPIWGEFLGDSEVYGILHNGGAVLFFVTVLFYGWLWVCFVYNKDLLRTLLFVCIALSCFAVPALMYNVTMPFLAYCFSFETEKLLIPKRLKGIMI